MAWITELPNLKDIAVWEEEYKLDMVFDLTKLLPRYEPFGTIEPKLKIATVVSYKNLRNKNLRAIEYRRIDTNEPFLIRWGRIEGNQEICGAALFIDEVWILKRIDEIIRWDFATDSQDKRIIKKITLKFIRPKELSIFYNREP